MQQLIFLQNVQFNHKFYFNGAHRHIFGELCSCENQFSVTKKPGLISKPGSARSTLPTPLRRSETGEKLFHVSPFLHFPGELFGQYHQFDANQLFKVCQAFLCGHILLMFVNRIKRKFYLGLKFRSLFVHPNFRPTPL